MFGLQTMVFACLLVGALAGGSAGWVGYRLADGSCSQREHDIAVAYATERNGALETARRQSDAETRRAVAAAETRSRASLHDRAVSRDAAADPDPRDCELRATQRLRLDTLYRAYGHAPIPAADSARMPDPVPAAPAPGHPARDVGN